MTENQERKLDEMFAYAYEKSMKSAGAYPQAAAASACASCKSNTVFKGIAILAVSIFITVLLCLGLNQAIFMAVLVIMVPVIRLAVNGKYVKRCLSNPLPN